MGAGGAIILRVDVLEEVNPGLSRVKPCDSRILGFRVTHKVRDRAIERPSALPRMIKHVLVPKSVWALSLCVIQLERSCTLWKTEQID
jgi:hypothetical protein